MGTGQTPPQNVICLLLGWTVIANKAEPIPSLLQHTHTHTPFFSATILQGTSQGRSEWEVGVREGSISVLRKARSLFPSAPPSSSKAHSPKKRAPKWKFSLILPPFSSLVWTQPETLGLPLGFCDLLRVPVVDKSRLTSSQMSGQFSNTKGHEQMHRFV